MSDIAPWAAGTAMALLALFGLVVASGAVDLHFYIFGLALFLFGVACVFGLITRHTGSPAPSATGPVEGQQGGTPPLSRPRSPRGPDGRERGPRPCRATG